MGDKPAPAADEAVVIDADGEEITPEPGTTAALVKVQPVSPLTRPVASYEDALVAFSEYERLRHSIVLDSDMQGVGGKAFVKKSGWRKMAVVMGVSSELRSRDYDRDDTGHIVRAEVIVRAVAPNGRFMDGLGVCDAYERCDRVCYEPPAKDKVPCSGLRHFSKSQHDIPATAYTRALNRACSDLFGFGEVSYEEVQGETGNDPADGFATHAEARARYDELVGAIRTLPGYRSRDDGGPDEGSNAETFAEFHRAGGYRIPYTLTQCDELDDELRRLGAQVPDPAATASETGPTGASDKVTGASATDDDSARERRTVAESSGSGGDGPGEGGLVGSAGTSSPSPAISGGDSPPAEPSGQEPPSDPAPVPKPAQGRVAAAPTSPAGRPSTAAQRQQVGARFAELVKAGFLTDRDKKELVSILTADRTDTTTKMTQGECSQMISTLRFLELGDLRMEDADDGGRQLSAATSRGNDFIVPILRAAEEARDIAPRESEVM